MSDPKTLDADTFRFSVEPRIAAPFHDSTTDHIVDAVDGRVVAVFDAHDRAVAVQEALESAHDVGVAARHALGQPIDPVPLTRLGDVLRENFDDLHRDHAAVLTERDAEANRAAEMEAQAQREQARADAAERMVVELRDRLRIVRESFLGTHYMEEGHERAIDAALANTAEVAGRWVPVEEHDEARLALAEISELVGPGGDDTPFGRVESIMSCLTAERDEAVAERDAAIARAEKTKGLFDAAQSDVLSLDAECRSMRAERDAAIAAMDAAEQMVAELGAFIKEAADDIDREDKRHAATGDTYDTTYVTETLKRGIAALSRTEAVAGRWVSREEHERAIDDQRRALGIVSRATYDAMVAERDAAIAARDEAVARRDAEVRAHYAAIDDRDEAFTEATAASRRASEAERARDEVGIQLAAAQERIKLLEEGATLLRDICDDARAVPAGFDGHYLVEKSVIDIGVGCYLARLDTVPGDALAPVGSEPLAEVDVFRGDDGVVVVEVGCSEPVRITLPDGTHLHGPVRVTPEFFDAVKAETLASISEPMPVPPSPAGASAPASGSTPGASSATGSSSEAVGNPSAPRGTCDASVRALIDAARAVDRCYDTGSSIRSSMYRLREALDGLRITAALEASGIDTSNVKDGRPEEGVCGACRSPVSVGCLCPPMADAKDGDA